MIRVIEEVQPDEIYNLAAQSFVATSWQQPILTLDVTGMGAVKVFEAVRLVNPKIKVFQASSSEMFGGDIVPQDENTPLKPRSPYSVSKMLAHEAARVYRESFDIPISRGILFNTEGPRRGIEFVTQKIVDAAVRQIWLKEDFVLELGNLEAKRDWSHVSDTVRGIYMMLQREPDDFVLASGVSYTVREFVNKVYEKLGEFLDWGYDDGYAVGYSEKILVKSVPKFYRPNELWELLGNPTKAHKVLGWYPEFTLEDLVEDMVETRISFYLEKQ